MEKVAELYMSPALTPAHQRVLLALVRHFVYYLDKHPIGEVLFAPIDVNLPDLTNPVQPDLIFISNERRDIIEEQTVEGVPDLIVEVVSPGSAKLDRKTKFNAYAEAGVQEYWIVDPKKRTVEVYTLRGHAYALLGSFSAKEQIRSELLPDFSAFVKNICSSS